ncbi:hypothetical protein [Limimaricola soesokkakensis]|uniref:hypothetical protein n=1 Tax=Limimaricola soesokkakensis TaxID=1343159 RepID=UPI003511E37D
MDASLEKLRTARKAVVKIVQARPDGARYLPMVLELERQIAQATNIGDELARIMAEVG